MKNYKRTNQIEEIRTQNCTRTLDFMKRGVQQIYKIFCFSEKNTTKKDSSKKTCSLHFTCLKERWNDNYIVRGFEKDESLIGKLSSHRRVWERDGSRVEAIGRSCDSIVTSNEMKLL